MTAVIDFFELATSFELPPEEALAFFQAKGLKPTFAWQDMLGDEHDAAFTIAKMMDTDLLQTVKSKLDIAIAQGKSLKDFKKELIPTLQAAGWWGKQDVIDPLTGAVVKAQLGSASRLETIFRTNIQSAYAAGQWEQIISNAQEAPYLLYDAVDDYRTRPEHAAMDGTVLPVTDKWWESHYPPNGWNCRCGVIQLTAEELAEYGLTPTPRPKSGFYEWTNPRTGKSYIVPGDLDPGWDHNSGIYRMQQINKVAAEKAAALETKAEQIALAQAAKLQKEANAKYRAELKAAQADLDQAIETNTPYLANAIKQVQASKAAAGLNPKEILELAKEKAAKTKQAAFLADYKAAKASGKAPSAKAQAAFDALSDAEKAKVAAAIEKKSGAAAAKQELQALLENPDKTYHHTAVQQLLDSPDSGFATATPSQQLTMVNATANQLAAKDLQSVINSIAGDEAATKAIMAAAKGADNVIDQATLATKAFATYTKKLDETLSAKLAAIAEGTDAPQASIKQKLWEKYAADGTAKAFTDIKGGKKALIDKIVAEAAAQQAKADAAAFVSAYKKNVIAGKIPTAKQKAAFDALPANKQAKVLADIEAKKAPPTPKEAPGEHAKLVGMGAEISHLAEDIATAGDWTWENAAALKKLVEDQLQDGTATLGVFKAILDSTQKTLYSALPYSSADELVQLAKKAGKQAEKKAAGAVFTMKAGESVVKKAARAPTGPAADYWLAGSKFDDLPVNEQWKILVKAHADELWPNAPKNDFYWKYYDSKPFEAQQEALFKLKDQLDAAGIDYKPTIAKWNVTGSIGKPASAIKNVTTPPVHPSSVTPEPLSMKNMTKTGAQKGSNTGGFYQDTTTGTRYYIKQPASEDIARNEHLAAKLYEAAGVEVPELTVWTEGKTTRIASKLIDGIREDAAALRAGTLAGQNENFIVDAWLGNWDVAGLNYDNLVVAGNRAIRIDVGGALRYRAQGSLKGAAWSDTVDEIESLRDAAVNRQTATAFANVTHDDMVAGARRILAISDDDIRELVDLYGPRDLADAEKLKATLIARKADIGRRFPEARAKKVVEPPPEQPKGTAITKQEVKRIQQSRQNGYSIPTDKDAIEDMQVLYWEATNVKGQQQLRAYLKVRGATSDNLTKRVRAQLQSTTARPKVAHYATTGAKEATLEAVKGIAKQAAEGGTFRLKDIQRLEVALERIGESKAALAATKYGAAGKQAIETLKKWEAELKRMQKLAKEGDKAQAWSFVFNMDELNNAIPEVKKTAKKAAAAEPEIRWKRAGRQHTLANIENGKQIDTTATSKRAPLERYETEIDGVRIIYYPEDSDQFALRGRLEIHAPELGQAGQARIASALEKLGVDTTRATADDIERLYLAKLAYVHKFDKLFAKRILEGDTTEQLREYVRKRIKDDIGVDILSPANRQHYQPEGALQAFEHGRRVQYRPDLLSHPEWDEFEAAFRVRHSVTDSDMPTAVERILNSGGQMAPTTDKIRRGIEMGGKSPEEDLMTGGANYFFTRLFAEGPAKRSSGFVWRARVVARADQIHYPDDFFGRTTGNTVSRSRATTISEHKKYSRNGGNEMIFKDSLSIFDDLDVIVTGSASEQQRVISILKKHGHQKWPDGRKLEDVVIVRSNY